MDNLKKIVTLICDRFDLEFDDVFNFIRLEVREVGELPNVRDNRGRQPWINALKVQDDVFFDPVSKRLFKEIEMD